MEPDGRLSDERVKEVHARCTEGIGVALVGGAIRTCCPSHMMLSSMIYGYFLALLDAKGKSTELSELERIAALPDERGEPHV